MTESVLLAEVLVDGAGEGPVQASDVPLSLWGGYDPATGIIIDHRHPLSGQSLVGSVFVVPHGKGSSTGSPVLVDALIQKTAPAAIILRQVDEIIALGGVVAEEFFQRSLPILVLDHEAWQTARTATFIQVKAGGRVHVFHDYGVH